MENYADENYADADKDYSDEIYADENYDDNDKHISINFTPFIFPNPYDNYYYDSFDHYIIGYLDGYENKNTDENNPYYRDEYARGLTHGCRDKRTGHDNYYRYNVVSYNDDIRNNYIKEYNYFRNEYNPLEIRENSMKYVDTLFLNPIDTIENNIRKIIKDDFIHVLYFFSNNNSKISIDGLIINIFEFTFKLGSILLFIQIIHDLQCIDPTYYLFKKLIKKFWLFFKLVKNQYFSIIIYIRKKLNKISKKIIKRNFNGKDIDYISGKLREILEQI